VVDPTGATVTVQYDKAGRPVSSVDSLNQGVELAYDNQDRLKSVLDGEANVTGFEYSDADGLDLGSDLAAKITYPTLQQLLRYNSRQGLTQVVEVADGQSRTTTFSYDGHGMTNSVTNPEGNSQSLERDAFGMVRTATDELGHAVRLTYNHRSLLSGATDSLSHATSFDFDARGHRVAETNALGQSTRFGYDDAGRMVSVRRPSGVLIEFEYDPGGRLTQRRSFRPDGSSEHVDGFTWDDGGRLVAWHTNSASATLTYDDANRLLSEVVSQAGKSLARAYTYYPNGQLQTFTGPDASTLTYEYDRNGLLARVDIPGQGAISVTEKRWTAPAKVQFPGGTSEEYERNGALQPTRLRVRSPNQSVLFEAKTTFGSVGEVDSRTVQGQLTEMTYDDAVRLVEADPPGQAEVFQLDAVGNRLSDDQVGSTWIYDAANRLLMRGEVSYSYDADGNLAQKIDARLAEPLRTTSFRYDGYNQLIEVRDGADQVVSRYGYDAFGYRISKELSEVGAARSGLAAGLTLFLQSSEGVLAEATSSGEIVRAYGWQPGQSYATGPLFQRSGSDYFFFHNDHLGTPWQMTDAAGRVVWSAEYTAFGTANATGAANVFQPWRLPGQYEDAETGLHYNLRRYYDPATGRYISSDPIGLAGGANLYSYVNGDPINLYDPRGLVYGNGEWEGEDLIFGPTYWFRETFLGDPSVSQAEFDFYDGFANGVVKGTTFGFFDANDIGIIDMSYADQCSEMFRYSSTAGEFWMEAIFPAGRAGYAAESAQLARKYRGVAEITEEVARAGVAARNNLKSKYRGLLRPFLEWWKRPPYEALRDGLYGSKIPKTDADIIAGLGKPNFGYTFPLLFGGSAWAGYKAYENQTEPMDGCGCD
jgi:RHS repeat-associated protein